MALIRNALENTDPGASNGGSNNLGSVSKLSKWPDCRVIGFGIGKKLKNGPIFWHPAISKVMRTPSGRIPTCDQLLDTPGSGLFSVL